MDGWIAHYDAMTLGELAEWQSQPGFACACAGCPLGSSACYCELTCMQMRALHRGAHIAVKLVAELL